MLRTSDLDYDLPQRSIATDPVEPRDAARLMVVPRGSGPIRDAHIRDLPSLLRAGDLLVFNTTRVLPARFRGRRPGTGGKVEGLYLSDAPSGGSGLRWHAFLKAHHLKPGMTVELADGQGQPSGYTLTVVDRSADEPGAWIVEVTGGPAASSALILDRIGLTPLPPYILAARRQHGIASDDAHDRGRYQTVFSQTDQVSSVAAPTAGLHFTPELLAALDHTGVRRAEVVLHVGSGTFKPVETEFVEQHPMHAEWCRMPEATRAVILETRARGGRVIPVGTTTCRTIEAYAIEAESGRSPDALATRLLLTPGSPLRWSDGLMTNFHLPRSTLMALAASFLEGEGVGRLKAAYHRALDLGYRFYSFGDAMLIVPE